MAAFKLKFYHILATLLVLTAFNQPAQADDMKINYHCTSEKAIEYRHTKASLGTTTELNYSPEAGENLNLVIGSYHQYILWIRKPYGETKRSVSVFKLRNQQIFKTLDLGEEGEPATATFNFEITDNNVTITGSCDISAE